MLNVFRELIKLLMFCIAFATPLWLAYDNNNNRFLWMFIPSFFVLFMIFSHYEDLAKYEKEKQRDEEE